MAGESFLLMVLLSALSSLSAALVPLLLYRNGVKKTTLHMLLGVSAGILFAIATIDLIPEGIAVSSEFQAARLLRSKQIQKDFARKEHVHDSGHKEVAAHGHTDHRSGEYGATVTMVGVGLGFFVLVLMEQMMLSFGVAHSHQPDETLLGNDEHSSHRHKAVSSQTGLRFELSA
jgi:uncharacterized membrane protein YeiB